MIKNLIFIVSVIFLLGLFFFLNQRWFIFHMPLKDFNSVGQVEDEGFIGVVGGEGGFGLLNLPSCKIVDDFYTDQGSPRIQYLLINKQIDLLSFIYKPVKVWGKVQVETTTRKSPEIVCIKAPCEATITTRTMFVEKIENNDDISLSSCQQDYLNNLSKGPKK